MLRPELPAAILSSGGISGMWIACRIFSIILRRFNKNRNTWIQPDTFTLLNATADLPTSTEFLRSFVSRTERRRTSNYNTFCRLSSLRSKVRISVKCQLSYKWKCLVKVFKKKKTSLLFYPRKLLCIASCSAFPSVRKFFALHCTCAITSHKFYVMCTYPCTLTGVYGPLKAPVDPVFHLDTGATRASHSASILPFRVGIWSESATLQVSFRRRPQRSPPRTATWLSKLSAQTHASAPSQRRDMLATQITLSLRPSLI